MGLLRYRIDMNSIQGPLADYLNNHKEFKILDNTSNTNTVLNYSNRMEQDEGEEGYYCSNVNNNQLDNERNRLTIRQFIKYYIAVYSYYRFDNKISPNIASFGKISPIKSNFAKFDNKDITTKNITEEKLSNNIITQQETQLESPPLIISCIHCSYQGKSENEVLVHSLNTHPGLPARPDSALLELMQQKKNLDKDDA